MIRNKERLNARVTSSSSEPIGCRRLVSKRIEQKGILFTPPSEYERSEALGAQCRNCHTILWITRRSDPILFKEIPNNRESYHDHNKHFLQSLPACPHCHQQAYDLFINNVVIPRYQNGDDPLLDSEYLAYIYRGANTIYRVECDDVNTDILANPHANIVIDNVNKSL